MKKLILAMMVIVGLFAFAGCENESRYVTPTESWQNVYAEILRDYIAENEDSDYNFHFLLHDIDESGVPELIVFRNDEDVYTAVYTFRNGEAVSLEIAEDVMLGIHFRAARLGVFVPPNNFGLIMSAIGPSAGVFGTSAWFSRVVIDENALIIDGRGTRYVDVDALNELFGGHGRGDYDDDILKAAIAEHTRWYIDDMVVSETEFLHVFEWGESLIGNDFWRDNLLTEENIENVIFG